MPLDARKIAHILSVVPRTFAGRQKNVVFVYQDGSSYSYQVVSCIFRPQHVVDRTILSLAGTQPRQQAEMLLIAPAGTSFNGLAFVADTATATVAAVAAAPKYQVIEAVSSGLIPAGTHIIAHLRRFR
ncbi:MAG: hypothetical protein IMW89_17835 [Ktedonobacteraceae bacterium]|nr:hypothetical protein [Ktedonobacteraceae bacterium]